MAKYVVDIPDDNIYDFLTLGDDKRLRLPMYNKDGTFNSFIHTNLIVIPYTEPDINVVEKAQDEVWELAKKIVLSIPSGGLAIDEINDCFGENDSFTQVLKKYTYQEAKVMYDAWKVKNNEIRVGDEVKSKQYGG